MESDIKYILSNSGWTSKDKPEERQISLETALEKESTKSVIAALRWVWRHNGFNDNIVDACKMDVEWIQDNFIQDGDVVKKIKNKEILYIVSKKKKHHKLKCRSCGFVAQQLSPKCPKCGKFRLCNKCGNLDYNCICE